MKTQLWGIRGHEKEQEPVGSSSGLGEAFGAGSIEASGQLVFLGWVSCGKKEAAELRVAHNSGERKELWETCPPLITCSSFQESSLRVSYVLGLTSRNAGHERTHSPWHWTLPLVLLPGPGPPPHPSPLSHRASDWE